MQFDMLNISICFIALLMSQINISISLKHHREKRFLIFPRGNPTRHQVSEDEIDSERSEKSMEVYCK